MITILLNNGIKVRRSGYVDLIFSPNYLYLKAGKIIDTFLGPSVVDSKDIIMLDEIESITGE